LGFFMKSSISFQRLSRIFSALFLALLTTTSLLLGAFSAEDVSAKPPPLLTPTTSAPFEGSVLRVIEPTLAHKEKTNELAVEAAKSMRTSLGATALNITRSREFAKPSAAALAVELDYAALQNSQIGDTLNFALPDGLTHSFVMDTAPVTNGETVTWIGRSSTFGNRFRAILSTGAAGTFGAIMTPTGEWRVSPGGAHAWLVNETAERVNEPKAFCDQSHGYIAGVLTPETEREIAARATMLPDVASIASKASAATQAKAGGLREQATPLAFIPTPQAVVDLLIIYTPQYATNLGSGLSTRLNALVARANQAYIDSGVAITLRLVHHATVNYNDNDFSSNSSTLTALRTGTGAFVGVPNLRNLYGADVVALLRDGPEFSSAGLGSIGGFAGQNYATAADQMFSVTTGCPRGCDVVFIHEIGHNMGAVHDRANAGTPGSNGQFGSFPYAFGWGSGSCFLTGSCPTEMGTDFGTIMSYQLPTVFKFSNPDELCTTRGGGAAPCGVPESNLANQSNVAKAFNNIRQTLSGFRASVVSPNQAGLLSFSGSAAVSIRRDAGSLVLTVQRTNGNAGAVSANYATADFTALSGRDYTAQSGTLSWADGDTTTRSIVVPLLNAATSDTRVFGINLSNIVTATLGAPAALTISLVSPPAAQIQFAAATAAISENSGSIVIPVKRINNNFGAVSVAYATANRTATAGSDYVGTSGVLNWTSGDTTDKNITVPIINDTLAEGSETFVVTLSNATGATLGAIASTEVTIYDPWPANNAMPAGFIQTPGTAANWALASDSTFEGGFSLKSGAIGDAATSATQITGNFTVGEVTFAYRVSSESTFDFLRFSIDGVEKAAFSGEAGWALFSTPITAGTHTLKWSYTKDNRGTGGLDRAWIDALTMPILGTSDVIVGTRLPYYRLFNPVVRAHIYTTDANENNVLSTRGFSPDGPIGDLLTSGATVSGRPTVPLYRLYNTALLRHLYTTDANEYNVLGNLGWTKEGETGYIASQPNPFSTPFHRLYNTAVQRHLWTTDQNEVNVLTGLGWSYDALVGYILRR
jgi:Metallo-peptidase family M12B Reprolysin-like/Calx-beta domain/Repeat of unknown function (DUF5648)